MVGIGLRMARLNTDFHSDYDLARDIFVLFSKRENDSEMG